MCLQGCCAGLIGLVASSLRICCNGARMIYTSLNNDLFHENTHAHVHTFSWSFPFLLSRSFILPVSIVSPLVCISQPCSLPLSSETAVSEGDFGSQGFRDVPSPFCFLLPDILICFSVAHWPFFFLSTTFLSLFLPSSPNFLFESFFPPSILFLFFSTLSLSVFLFQSTVTCLT